jgi:hypothetical protein
MLFFRMIAIAAIGLSFRFSAAEASAAATTVRLTPNDAVSPQVGERVTPRAQAVVTPAIISAEASDELTGEFILRTPKDAAPDLVRLTVSGAEFLLKPEYGSSVAVVPHVLIDLGPPVTTFQPRLSAAMTDWITTLAAKGKSANPQWMFQFIAGDQNICRLSQSFPASEVAARIAPAALKKLAVAKGLPLNQEVLLDMKRLFSDDQPGTSRSGDHQAKTHTLVVLSSSPPVWIAREATEWFTRDPDAGEPERKVLGRDAQWRLKIGESSVIRDISDWIAAGHLVPIVIASGAPHPLPPEWVSLRHGTEEVLARFHTFRSPDELLASGLLDEKVEHRGSFRIPLTQLQRPASGVYSIQLTANDTKGGNYRSREMDAVDRAFSTWRPWLLWAYGILMGIVTISLVITWVAHYNGKEPADLNTEFSDLVFKIGSGFGLLTLGVCTRLISNTDKPSLWISLVALIAGIAALIIGAMSWYAKTEQLRAARSLA